MAYALDKLLRKLYYTPGTDSAYGSVNTLYRAAKAKRANLRKSQVEDWLLSQDSYTLHKQARKKLSAEPRVMVSGIDEQWALDLCDMSNIKDYNDNYCFILTAIDVFSKRAWAHGAKNKSAAVTAEAFLYILKQANGRRPQQIETDHGKEFYNERFRQLCWEQGIHHFSTTSSNKASTVERFNRTLKSLLYRYFTANNTYRWIDVLPDILNTYNSRWHRSIRTAPNLVSNANEKHIYRVLYSRKPKLGKRLRRGDKVRISKKKRTFEKGYLPNFTDEVFEIRNVLSSSRPYLYQIDDMSGEQIVGRFAPEELQKVIKDAHSLWKIERILHKRGRGANATYLVKWRGFPDKFNSYVSQNDIVSLT